jgi:hypothetical protein
MVCSRVFFSEVRHTILIMSGSPQNHGSIAAKFDSSVPSPHTHVHPLLVCSYIALLCTIYRLVLSQHPGHHGRSPHIPHQQGLLHPQSSPSSNVSRLPSEAFDSAENRASAGVEFIKERFGYPEEDVKAWLETVKWTPDAREVKETVLRDDNQVR